MSTTMSPTTPTATPEVATPKAAPVTLTPNAIAKVKEIMAQQTPVPAGLRVGVQGGGCSGFSYAMSFENSAGMMDKTFNFDGVKVFVDATSVMYLNGCVVDYVETLEGAGFKFENPNVKSTCGCGSSFSVLLAQVSSRNEIAPSHDGAICIFRENRGALLLLLRRGRRRLRRRRTTHRIVVAKSTRLAKRAAVGGAKRTAIGLAEGTAGGAARLPIRLPIHPGLQGLAQLQLRLVGRPQKAAEVRGGIVYKYPLIVFVLVVELTNCGVLAYAGHTQNRPTAEYLATALTTTVLAVLAALR